jgi:uncharacterized protein YbaR (Trm112 family)
MLNRLKQKAVARLPLLHFLHSCTHTLLRGGTLPLPLFPLFPLHSFRQLDTTERHMPIPKELLDILVCPVCKAPVKPTPDDSGLKCQSCRRVYPVRDDIPVMLAEEATIAPE